MHILIEAWPPTPLEEAPPTNFEGIFVPNLANIHTVFHNFQRYAWKPLWTLLENP
jgi:hypothetical protein